MLQYNKEYMINPKNIASILNDAKPEWEKRKKLYKMKTRKEKPSNLVAETDNEMKEPFESVISNMINGYVGGKSPIYQVEEMPTKEKFLLNYLIKYLILKIMIGKNINCLLTI